MSHLSATPADELEVKARVDDPEELRAALVRAGAALEFRGDMIDRRFDRDGTLAERDHVLRLREYRPADGTRLRGARVEGDPPRHGGSTVTAPKRKARVETPDLRC